MPATLSNQPGRTPWIDGYRLQLRISEIGKVAAIGDGIAWIEGLPSAAMDEILRFEDGSEALVFHLGSRRIGAILLNRENGLVAGASAHLTGRRLDIGVGDDLSRPSGGSRWATRSMADRYPAPRIADRWKLPRRPSRRGTSSAGR
ncbi:MAG: hypothetical protein MZW92_46945 [Comamonadaceae bacterium]|nr:hypothetical protein [Comamonadaceae bacterium]